MVIFNSYVNVYQRVSLAFWGLEGWFPIRFGLFSMFMLVGVTFVCVVFSCFFIQQRCLFTLWLLSMVAKNAKDMSDVLDPCMHPTCMLHACTHEDGRTDMDRHGQTDGRTERRTDRRRTDRQAYRYAGK